MANEILKTEELEQVAGGYAGKNVYKLNGKKADYEEVWEHICKEKGFGYNLFD